MALADESQKTTLWDVVCEIRKGCVALESRWASTGTPTAAMEIVLLIGAAPYRLDERTARLLEATIRETCLDDTGRPIAGHPTLRACLQIADVLREALERGSSPEPVELGHTHAEGLCVYVLRDEVVEGNDELTALYFACQRFRRDPR